MRFTAVALLLFSAALGPGLRAADEEMTPEIPRSSALKSYSHATATWKWSLAPLAASQTLDIVSSYNLHELNPVLAGSRGEFGAKATLLKGGVTAALIGIEYAIVKAHPPAARIFTKINWSGAALTTAFAAHNFSQR